MPGSALVLFSHGSLLCGSGSILQHHARQLRNTGKYLAVEPGYLNYCAPPVEEAIARCLAAGARQIIIVPYFLVSGKFVTEDLPARIKTASADYSGIEILVAAPLKDAQPMRHAVYELLKTAAPPGEWQKRAITRAHNHCELRQDCPLYGSPMCRKSFADAE